MAGNELISVLTRIADSLEDISDLLKNSPQLARLVTDNQSELTNEIAPEEIEEAVDDTSYLEQFLEEQQIKLLASCAEVEDDSAISRLSDSLGKNYPILDELIKILIEKGPKSGNFSLSLAGLPNDTVSTVCNFATQIYKLDYLQSYKYHKSPKFLIEARASNSKAARKFLSEGWLENYIFIAVKRAVGLASSMSGLPAKLRYALEPKLETRDGNRLALGLMISLNETCFWIEGKAGDSHEHIDSMTGISADLGLSAEHSILVLTDVSPDLSRTLSKLMGMTVLSVETLEDSLLALFQSSLKDNDQFPDTNAGTTSSSVTNNSGLDPVVITIGGASESPVETDEATQSEPENYILEEPEPLDNSAKLSIPEEPEISDQALPEVETKPSSPNNIVIQDSHSSTEPPPELPAFKSVANFEHKSPVSRTQKASQQNKHALPKSVLASYYTDARLNILACLNDIRDKWGQKPMKNDDQIRAAFNSLQLSQAETERQSKMVKQLRNRFPFLDLLTDRNVEKSDKDKLTPLPHYYESDLKWMLELVNGLRNTMVHPVDNEFVIPYGIHKKLYMALSKIYDSSFHTVKTRFQHSSEAMSPFKRCDGDGKPRKYSNFSLALCTDPIDLDEDSELPQSGVLYDFGHVLFCSLFLEKRQSAELINYFWQTRHGQQWPGTDQRSIIREMAIVFRARMPFQRLKSDDTSTAVTLDTLSELARCPRPLLGRLSPEDQERFRGEMGGEHTENEAENGPTYLFARSKQDRFIPLLMRFFDFNPNNKIRFAIDLGQFYFNVRLKPASQFTDDCSRVRRLGQKVLTYGRLVDFEKAEKPEYWLGLEENYSDSQRDEEELLGLATDEVQQLKPYLVKTYPHYHYFEDKIGFRIEGDEHAMGYPDLVPDTADIKSPVKLNPIANQSMMPEFWMSPGQMLHLVFYSYLQNTLLKQGNDHYFSIELILTLYRVGMVRLLKALKQGDIQLGGEPRSEQRRDQAQQWLNSHFDSGNEQRFQVSLNSLPKVVINYLLGGQERQVAVSEVIARAKHILDDTERRIKRLTNQMQINKKRGKKGFEAIKCGHMGDFLAEDMMRFQPVNPQASDGGKINSQQYQILQAALAYYGAHIDRPPRIVDLLKDAGLLGGKFPHPFLHELDLENRPDQYQGLVSFYEAYLAARKRYLETFIREHRNRDKINFLHHWLRLRQSSTLDSWLSEQIDEEGNLLQPLPLANNMFYSPILNMLGELLDQSPQHIEQEGMQYLARGDEEIEIKPAVTWLMRYYLEELGDAPQAMYDYPRQHDLLDAYLDQRSDKQRFQEKTMHYLPEWKRMAHVENIREYVHSAHMVDPDEAERCEKLSKLLKVYKRDERKVRYALVQDMLLYMHARQYLEDIQLSGFSKTNTPDWSLENIETSLLNTEIRYVLKVPDTDKKLVHPSCKIRDLGEMTLLVKDRRLPGLLQYYRDDETELHHAEIRAELNSYRRAKVAIMKMIHELENQILRVLVEVPERTSEQLEQSIELFGKGRHGDFLYALFLHYQQNAPDDLLTETFDRKHIGATLLIRNAFSHNQYPDAGQFYGVVSRVHSENVPENPANHRKVAERLMQGLEKLYSPWLDYLQGAN